MLWMIHAFTKEFNRIWFRVVVLRPLSIKVNELEYFSTYCGQASD